MILKCSCTQHLLLTVRTIHLARRIQSLTVELFVEDPPLNDTLFLLLFVPLDYCRIPKTKGYFVHRSTVVSTYWIWSCLYVSSTENMEVCSGVLIIAYNRPSIKTLKRSDNRSWTEMFNRLFRGKFVCCLLSEPHLFIDGPFMIRFLPSPQRNET